MDPQHFDRIARAMPVLQGADPELLREFKQAAFYARIPAGREITLYRFGQGESCILTANAILSRQSFPAIATVERDAEAVMVPAETFRDWVKRYDRWRGFVFDLLSQRLSSMMEIVDEIAFRRLDRRVAELLG